MNDKITLYCREAGEGEPLILLHGNGESGEYFVHQIEFFAKKYRVLAPDTRGHGQSPRGEGAFNLAHFVEDLKDFMDEKGIDKAHILGFSDGGNTALMFALKYPERVKKLIVNGANLEPAGADPAILDEVRIPYWKASLAAKETGDAEAVKQAEMLGLMVEEPHIDPVRLKELKMETLVIAGTEDVILEEHTKFIASCIPDAKLAILPGDHFVAAGNPEVFNQTVAEFLQA